MKNNKGNRENGGRGKKKPTTSQPLDRQPEYQYPYTSPEYSLRDDRPVVYAGQFADLAAEAASANRDWGEDGTFLANDLQRRVNSANGWD